MLTRPPPTALNRLNNFALSAVSSRLVHGVLTPPNDAPPEAADNLLRGCRRTMWSESAERARGNVIASLSRVRHVKLSIPAACAMQEGCRLPLIGLLPSSVGRHSGDDLRSTVMTPASSWLVSNPVRRTGTFGLATCGCRLGCLKVSPETYRGKTGQPGPTFGTLVEQFSTKSKECALISRS
jgi:hypothetical protein